ncbi:hypothetical protein BV22DRAFT_733384 [Leucogyrophana mollusca]|uniref:Uncharacterized protein n=1 Tax=Leucogyrophana mollusca TaxID=85980 RepID=A0ACB8B7M7_9AGAM|nr:hypothetical protein BV22DRAFT_733384 [Leucogyrophana mollusca]
METSSAGWSHVAIKRGDPRASPVLWRHSAVSSRLVARRSWSIPRRCTHMAMWKVSTFHSWRAGTQLRAYPTRTFRLHLAPPKMAGTGKGVVADCHMHVRCYVFHPESADREGSVADFGLIAAACILNLVVFVDVSVISPQEHSDTARDFMFPRIPNDQPGRLGRAEI